MSKNNFVWLLLLLAAGLLIVSMRLAYVENRDASPQEDAVMGEEAVIENIMTRSSVKKFTDEAPTDSMVQTLLKAGMAAHSIANKQPWRMVVIVDDDVRDSLAVAAHNLKSVASAPVAIAVCGVPSETFQNEGDAYWVADCSAMAENIALAAHAMGLGTSICAVYPRAERVEKVRKALELPDSVVPYAVVPVGYSAAATTAKDKWNEDKVSYK